MASLTFSRRARSRRAGLDLVAGWLAFWIVTAIVAWMAPAYVGGSFTKALTPAAAVVGVVVALRAPMLVLGVLTALSVSYVSLELFTGLPIYQLMLAVVALFCVTTVVTLLRGQARLRPAVAVWLLAALAGVSVLWIVGSDIRPIAQTTWRYVYLFPLGCVALAVAPFPALRSDRVARVFLLAGLATAAYAVLRWQTGAALDEASYAQTIGGRYNAADDGTLRPLGAFGDTHALSSVVGPLTAFAFALALGMRGHWRWIALATAGMAGTALVASDVRSGLAAAGVGCAVAAVLTVAARAIGTRRLAAVWIGLLLAAGGVVVAAVSKGDDLSEDSKRFGAILSPKEDASFRERSFRWQQALREVDNRPLGHGLGTATNDFRQAQRFESIATFDLGSSYLRIAYEQGFLYAVAFMAALLLAFVSMAREAVIGSSARSATFAIGGAAALIAWAIQLNFETLYIGAGTACWAWLLIGLGLRQVAWGGVEPGDDAEPAPVSR